jgi:hypothetical protein
VDTGSREENTLAQWDSRENRDALDPGQRERQPLALSINKERRTQSRDNEIEGIVADIRRISRKWTRVLR